MTFYKRTDSPADSTSLEPKKTSGSAVAEPIRVLFVMDKLGYPGGVSHGPAHYLKNVLPRFDQALVKPQVCVLSPLHPFAKQLESVGVYPIFLNRQKWDPRVLSDILKLIRRGHIQVIQLFGMKACIIGRIASRITDTRAIIHVRDMTPMGAILRFLQRRLAAWTDLALAISEAIKAFTVKELGVREEIVQVVNNPIVLSEFSSPSPQLRSAIRAQFEIGDHENVIGVIGRLHPDKGHSFLMRLMPALLAECPKVVLLVVGDGPMRGECEALARELELEGAIRFAGHRNDIAAILTAVDVVVMPSIREGFGLAALEAIAAGKPVVASKVGGLPEIVIDGKTGFLVEPSDKDGFVRGLSRLLSDPLLIEKQREECRQYVQRFAVEKHVDLLTTIYTNLMRDENASRSAPNGSCVEFSSLDETGSSRKKSDS